MNHHELKCWPEPFEAVVDGSKKFEFRKNDRGFAVGDFLTLKKWLPNIDRYTGDEAICRVTYLLEEGFGVPEGYCVMSIDLLFKS